MKHIEESEDEDDFINPLAIVSGEWKFKEDKDSDKEGFESDASIADELDGTKKKGDKSKLETKK